MKEADTLRNEDFTAYSDGRYTLLRKASYPYLVAEVGEYKLTCHPYEPCLYITNEDGFTTAVHNAFDPYFALDSFRNGELITSITGREYDARDFCRMVEYAADKVDVNIDAAERVFGDAPKKKRRAAPPKEAASEETAELRAARGSVPPPEHIITDERFSRLIAGYPDLAVDYCLVENGHTALGAAAHRTALARACHELFVDREDGETIWNYDVGRAEARRITAAELFAPGDDADKLNYRRAFLSPPYGSGCTDADFDRVNAALFPNGTDGLEVYEWTTDWSEYFEDGREWWGALCLTVYDKTLDRFAVITASATD